MPYEPTLISPEIDIKELVQVLGRELQDIANAYNLPLIVQVDKSHAEPERPRDGMVVYADGTDWNPGSGEGLYIYYNSTWHFGVATAGHYLRTVTTYTAGTTQTQAGATVITTDSAEVDVVTANGDGMKLPSAVAGMRITIANTDSTQNIQIWPNTSDTIDGGTADAVDANTLAAGATRTYNALTTTKWYTE